MELYRICYYEKKYGDLKFNDILEKNLLTRLDVWCDSSFEAFDLVKDLRKVFKDFTYIIKDCVTQRYFNFKDFMIEYGYYGYEFFDLF